MKRVLYILVCGLISSHSHQKTDNGLKVIFYKKCTNYIYILFLYKNKILLYMNDGYTVDGTIRNFAEKMKLYPSIVSQVPEDEEGIIHIGVGAYFDSFTSED